MHVYLLIKGSLEFQHLDSGACRSAETAYVFIQIDNHQHCEAWDLELSGIMNKAKKSTTENVMLF